MAMAYRHFVVMSGLLWSLDWKGSNAMSFYALSLVARLPYRDLKHFSA